MIQKQMRVSMAVTLGMLFMMLAFGRGRLAPFYDHVGMVAAEFAARVGAEISSPVNNETSRAGQPLVPSQESSESGGEESATATGLATEPHDAPAQPAAPPDPQAVRDSAADEVTALGPLHDELIEVLEAIQEAQTDSWEKRLAGDRVTMARLAKRMEIRDLRLAIADGRPEWSVRSARRSAASARARLGHDTAEARQKLAALRLRPNVLSC